MDIATKWEALRKRAVFTATRPEISLAMSRGLWKSKQPQTGLIVCGLPPLRGRHEGGRAVPKHLSQQSWFDDIVQPNSDESKVQIKSDIRRGRLAGATPADTEAFLRLGREAASRIALRRATRCRARCRAPSRARARAQHRVGCARPTAAPSSADPDPEPATRRRALNGGAS